MSQTQDHYDRHLGQIYAWMVGDFDAAVEASADLLTTAGVLPSRSGKAVDLGCGHGVQSVPLADGGYRVLAIDTCERLLHDLRKRGRTDIETVNGDLMDFRIHLADPVEAIVCMGDTLTHLVSEEAALSLVGWAADALLEGGHLCLSFRDYTGRPLEDSDRFIPVKLEDDRLHTCILEDDGDHVRVTDLVHNKTNDKWQSAASSYRKAKVSPKAVKRAAEASGLRLTTESSNRGMLFLGFRR